MSLFLTKRFYGAFSAVIVMTAAGYFAAPLFGVGLVLLGMFVVTVLAECVLLYARPGITGCRECAQRFSNGDENEVGLLLKNDYDFAVRLEVVDEIPVEFQFRDAVFHATVERGDATRLVYHLHPVRRGAYAFGLIRVFASTQLGLVQRRYSLGGEQTVKVYPSYRMLRQYELLAIHHRLTDFGIKKIRRVGHHAEFEQIKGYVAGDDYRTINWKATARKSRLMVNVYQDERAQQVYSVIDKGRVMRQSFNGMTLLDYAINAALILSYVAINKEDKAGLLTFADKVDTFLQAARRPGHVQELLEALYQQQTTFAESDFSALVAEVNLHVSKRSLLVVYTNFTGKDSMLRQLPYLKQLNRCHRVLVVYFLDDALVHYLRTAPDSTEAYYQHVIAEKYANEQRMIVHVLRQHGIQSILATPATLSVDVVNKYLELKSRQLLN